PTIASSTVTLTILIPPIIPLTVYGIQTEISVGKLLIAGVIRGIALATVISGFIIIVSFKNKNVVKASTWRERFTSLKRVLPAISLIVFVMSLLYLVIATSTEVAAFGAFAALFIGLILKRLDFKAIYDSLITTARQTSMIFLIVIGANIFANFIATTRIGIRIVEVIVQSGLSVYT